MNKNTAKARRILRERTAANRLTASLRRGRARSIATHAIAAGVPAADAKGIAGGLRSVAKRLNITPVRIVDNRRNDRNEGKVRHHYTADQVAALRVAYRPRKPEYVAAAALMALAA